MLEKVTTILLLGLKADQSHVKMIIFSYNSFSAIDIIPLCKIYHFYWCFSQTLGYSSHRRSTKWPFYPFGIHDLWNVSCWFQVFRHVQASHWSCCNPLCQCVLSWYVYGGSLYMVGGESCTIFCFVISPWTKWLTFHRRFLIHFHEWKVLYFESIFTEVCS